MATPLTRSRTAHAPALPPPGQRIALASDAAFSFVYPHVLRAWRDAGAEIVTFSPLADEAPPESCDCCWLPGGYPELHAGALAAAQRFRRGLARHAMTGLLSHATSFAERRLQLGYREACLLVDSSLGPAGSIVRGHEFHYATIVSAGSDEALVDLADGQGRRLGPAGSRRGRVTGTFFHAVAQRERASGSAGLDERLR
jgi:cobyrinic acid a,c-diamide synthase